ncbi:glycerophosphodiester phosphodiesterase [Ramlibacter sp. XY19]|uniref:glycerophosphodiester phosphodiesterase n=1 Tax=Ramlibacter paludis TaxID=2908000 RepID=UPI0023DC0B8A|nr:glycerophosphodiester phosphodiesterase [Ramlibacter paludis]MCG2594141.1 glycerophosphodiester phosphodiesterase [Ramlibacter paludis]
MRHSTLARAALLAAALFASSAFAFDLQGHRGGRGLSPENTLPAFERALALGVDTLELDVGLTADGVVVVSHDPYLNPMIARDANGQWLEGSRGPLIKSLTLAQLRAYDVGRIRPDSTYAASFATQEARDGTRVPTLAELFALVKARRSGVRFNIETKVFPNRAEDTVAPEVLTRALLAVIQEAGMQSRVSIQSFDWRTLKLVQQLAPAIPTVYLTSQTATSDNSKDPAWTAGLRFDDHGSVPRMVKAAGGAAWSPNGPALTEPLVKEAHALGLQVIPWTINNPADMERFIAWGVDGIITDYPDRLREVMGKRGMPLPAPAPN